MPGTSLSVFGTSLTGFVPAGGIDEGETVARLQSHEMFGLKGATTIHGELRPKEFRVSVHLAGLASEGALTSEVAAIRALVGQTGTVAVSGKRNISWADSQLQQVEDSSRLGGRPNPADSGKWHQEITLRFLQLR